MRKTIVLALVVLIFSVAGISVSICQMKQRSAFDGNWILDSSVATISESEIRDRKVVATFDLERMADELGEGGIDTWTSNPSDDTQICRIQTKKENYDGGTGKSLAIMYDVESQIVAANGCWIRLNHQNLKDYSHLSFWIKGDEKIGFSNLLGIGIVDAHGKVVNYRVTPIKADWRPVYLDLKKERKLIDWENISKIRIFFKSTFATRLKGKLYIDQLEFLRVGKV